jgi:microcystin-dependent protein
MTGTVRARDPNTGTMVPVLGAGMTRAAADAKYVMVSGDIMTGDLIARDPTYTAPGAEDSTVVSRNYVDGTNVGMIVPYAGPNIPAGWIWCSGDAYSRTTYWRLWNVIGTNYGGGDGVNTFNVPNMLGRIWVGCGSTWYFDGMGEANGTQSVGLDGSMVPHESGQFEMHDAGSRTMIYGVSGGISTNLTPGNYRTGYQNSSLSGSKGGMNINLGFGGNPASPHNNIMWSMTMHYIIKY